MFGFKRGLVVAMCGKNLGNLLTVLVARYVLKNTRARNYFFSKFTMLRAIELAINEQGFKMIVLVRFLALPLTIKNVGLGLLDIPVTQIMAAALITGFPFACCWSYLGSSASSLVDIYNGKSAKLDLPPWVTGVGALVMITLYALVAKHVKKAYADLAAHKPDEPTTTDGSASSSAEANTGPKLPGEAPAELRKRSNAI
jgi:uncharacterized membrane protein YdjX (TVP38/TMEM64 family)